MFTSWTFTPKFIRFMAMPPEFENLIDLLGSHQDPECGENKHNLNDLSPYDELRRNVLDAYGNPKHRNLMNDRLYYKDKLNVMSKIHTLVTTINLGIGETQLTLSLDDGFFIDDHLAENEIDRCRVGI